MNKITIHYGIDPDLEKSGVAVYDSETKSFDYIKTMEFWELIEDFKLWNIPFEVVIEAGWLNKPKNFHDLKLSKTANSAADKLGLKGHNKNDYIRNYMNKVSDRVSANVGENHAVGKLLEQYCIAKKIRYRLAQPTISKEYRKSVINNLLKLNLKNQELIDAAYLVFESQPLKAV